MSYQSKIYLFSFYGAVTLLMACWILLFLIPDRDATSGLGAMCKNIGSRIVDAHQIPAAKLVAIGGSGVRYGINMEKVGAALQMPAFNFGLQAGMGPGLILYKAKSVLKPGDTALLVFEYQQYAIEKPNTMMIGLMRKCCADYFTTLPVLDKLQIIMGYDPVSPMISIIRDTIRRGKKKLVQNHGEASKFSLGDDRGYGEAQKFGDLPLNINYFKPPSEEQRDRLKLYRYQPVKFSRTAPSARAIQEFVVWAREKHIRVLATWPNTIYFEGYEKSAGLKELQSFYDSLGASVVGKPQQAMYPLKLFLNTQYHLDIAGVKKRTTDLIELLRTYYAKNLVL